ncbi:Rrf2 family transcriptional regulator [Candidatus Woesearchaeota archaeon]|nr:Rrf2 family transcriptional regulator [Candidatus Woesearchaeota archaeon]
MRLFELTKKLEGLHTVDSIAKSLDVNRRTAVNYVHMLRKNGLVETIYGKRKIRMYRISPFKKIKFGYPGLYEFLNQNSKIKVYAPYGERIYDHNPSPEEMIVRAVKTGDLRTVLASLALFNKIKKWPRLGKIAKSEFAGRKVGALYDAARTIIRVKRMDKKTRKSLLNSRIHGKFIVKNARTKDLNSIEKEWKIYLPFNKADLEAYKE